MKTAKNKSAFKICHIALLSLLIPTILSNNIKTNFKFQNENNQQTPNENITQILFKRKLDFKENVEEICSKSSNDLKNYYLTGDSQPLKLDKIIISNNTNNPNYIQSLVEIVAGEGNNEQNINTYSKHISPFLVFFAIGLLSIPIWICFLICWCCNCCWCKCCKKEKFILPFLLVSIIFQLLVISISLYGLSECQTIFEGLSNTECTFLKFIEQITDGESKSGSRWMGFTGIRKIFNNLEKEIEDIGEYAINELSQINSDKTDSKNAFVEKVNDYLDFVNRIKNNFGGTANDGKSYRIDVVEQFGNKDDLNIKTTFIYLLNEEYKKTTDDSDDYLDDAIEYLGNCLKTGAVKNVLDQADKYLINLEKTVNDIKNTFSDQIVKYANLIDNIGKSIFIVVYVFIIIANIVTILFLVFLFLIKKNCGAKCCVGRNIIKVIIHIGWNFLAFFMVCTFLIGSVFTFFGIVGDDLITVVSYYISEKNLLSQKPLFFGDTESGQFINVCVNGEGEILDELNINGKEATQAIQSLSTTNDLLMEIYSILRKVPEIAFTTFDIDKRKNYQTVGMTEKEKYGMTTNFYYLNSLLTKITDQSTRTWAIDCSTNENCLASENCIRPQYCSEDDMNTYAEGNLDDEISKLNLAISDCKKINENIGDKSVYYVYTDLRSDYKELVEIYKSTINSFRTVINKILSVFEETIGESSKVYDFVNCKFIGTNIYILLKYLKEIFGKSIYNLGVALMFAGYSLILSIASTILEVVIINEEINKEKTQIQDVIIKNEKVENGEMKNEEVKIIEVQKRDIKNECNGKVEKSENTELKNSNDLQK